MPNDLMCEVCNKAGLNNRTLEVHQNSKAHAEQVALTAENPSLPPDLQAAVDAYDEKPYIRAQMVRAAFGARGWPNETHPGTVRDFLVEYEIPFYDVPRHASFAEGAAYAERATRELMTHGRIQDEDSE